jgi:hypothetical protein
MKKLFKKQLLLIGIILNGTIAKAQDGQAFLKQNVIRVTC